MIRSKTGVTLILLVLLAFTSRTYQLDAKSIWLDESLSLQRADQGLWLGVGFSLFHQFRWEIDANPPLFYVLLHFMLWAGGDSDFTLRFPSVFFGVALVPLTYIVGKRLFSRPVGLLSALLTTLSPFYLWYSQESRLYVMLTFLGLLSTYSLWRAWEEGKRIWYVGYVLITIAMLHTGLFGFLLLAFQGLMGLVHRPRSRWPTVSAFAVILLASTPLLLSATELGIRGSWMPVTGLWTILYDLLNSFDLGLSVNSTEMYFINAIYLAIFAIGVLALEEGGLCPRLRQTLFLVGYIFVPIMGVYLFSLLIKPMYQGSRYLMLISPAYYLALGNGLATIRRKSILIFFMVWILILSSISFSTYNYFFSPAYKVKEDFRSVARYIEDQGQPGDAIVNFYPSFAFRHYYRGNLPWISLTTSNVYEPRKPASLDEMIEEAIDEYERIWWIESRIWMEGIKEWLDENCFKIDEVIFGGSFSDIYVFCYLTESPFRSSRPAVQHPKEANFEGKIMFWGYDLLEETHRTGERVRLNLYWQAMQDLTESYKISMRLVDDEGHIWGQRDSLPLNGFYPTQHWRPGQFVTERSALPIYPGTPPGSYRLEMRVYLSTTSEELTILNEDGEAQGTVVDLAPLNVSKPLAPIPPSKLLIRNPLKAKWGHEIELLGFDSPSGPVRPGDRLPLSLYYRTLNRPKEDYLLALQLRDRAQKVVVEEVLPPAGEAYPTTWWEEGEIIRGQYDLVIPAEASSGEYTLSLRMHNSRGEGLPLRHPPWSFLAKDSLDLLTLQVQAVERLYEIPSIQHPKRAKVGDSVEFLGYALDKRTFRPEETLHLVLYWQAKGWMGTDYTVFTHLLDADGRIRGQKDNMPVNGSRPTTGWAEGEIIVDEYEIRLNPDAPRGEYTIEIGMYEAESGARLPILDGNGQVIGDHILLGTIQITPPSIPP